MTTWIGCDPGSRWTGVVAREGTRLLGWRIIDLQDVEPGADRPGIPTFESICNAIGEVADPASARVAVEDLIPPNPHVVRKNGLSTVGFEHMLNVREVIGYLRCAFPALVLVRPDGHGSRTLSSYPRDLVTKREADHADKAGVWFKPAPQNSRMRHARSGYDVAGAGAAAARIQLALARRASVNHP